MDGAEALDGAEGIDQEVVVVLHVRRIDFQEEIEVAGDVVAFRHLGNVLDAGDKVVGYVLAHASEADAAEDYEAAPQAGRAEDRRVALDAAAGFQAAHALEDGGGREVDLEGKVLYGDASVFLKGLQYEDVCPV